MRISRRPSTSHVPRAGTPPAEQAQPAPREDRFHRSGDGTTPAAPATGPRVPGTLSPVGALIAARTGAAPQQAEGDAAFNALKDLVDAGTLRASDRALLADGVSQVGIIGFSQAVKAARMQAALPDRAAFTTLLDGASSDVARAFLFKALAAGHGMDDIRAFAAAITGMSDDDLVQTLNLGDATAADDGRQNGVKQQWKASCVPTTAEILRAEMDPVYALAVRRANADVSAADDADGMKANPALAEEQKTLLETVGLGTAVPRAMDGGSGSYFDEIDDVCNTMTPWTGFTYAGAFLDDACTDPATVNDALDHVAKQLDLGIPTPILVGVVGAPKCHCAVMLEERGTGPQQQFLVHDPWTAQSSWVTRQAFLEGKAGIGTCQVLGAWYPATPA